MLLFTSNTFVPYNHPIEEADVIFLGIPFGSTSININSVYGPTVVRESLKMIEFCEKTKKGFLNVFNALKVCDLGNLEIVPGSYELTAYRIKETIKEIKSLNENAFLVFIGGEHLISLPICEELRPKTILQFDSHSDCLKDYLGNRYTHQTWCYHVSDFAKIIQVGVNTWNDEEIENVKKKNIQSLSLQKLPIMEPPIHLTIDVDVFDPSYVKTGFPEGNMKPEEFFSIMEKIPKISSMDVVEIADNELPSKTGFLIARVIKNILAKLI